MTTSPVGDPQFKQLNLSHVRAIVGRHVRQGLMSDQEGSALLEVEDAWQVSEELARFELRWLRELLQGECLLPGKTFRVAND
jgi:hypothetical protein